MIGIYKISSIKMLDRIYIGSSINISKRWKEHLNDLKRHKHHSIKLQRHYDKYGVADIHFSIITECEKADIENTEQFFIDAYKPYFNSCPKVGSPHLPNVSEETRKKMSEKRKGFEWSEEVKRKMSESATGNKNSVGIMPSEETREKLRQSKIGNTWGFKKGHKTNVGVKWSEERRREHGENRRGEKNGFYGKHLTEQHKRILRDRDYSGENNGMFGKKHTEEARIKMGNAMREAWKKRKAV